MESVQLCYIKKELSKYTNTLFECRKNSYFVNKFKNS